MKRPYTALFALAVWYLIAPPKMLYYGTETWDLNAPPAQWAVVRTFDTGEECAQTKADADYEANQIRPTFDVNRCIASEDVPNLSN